MDSRLRTNLLLVAALAVAGLLIAYGPEPEKASPGMPLLESAEEISRIAVYKNDKLRFALERVDKTWRLAAPVELPAAMFHVEALLAALHEPASRRYRVTETDPAALGLAAPAWRIEVDSKELLLGDRTALGNLRYVRAGEYVYLVNDLLVYRIQRNPFDYVTRRVLPESGEVRSIRLPSGQTVERTDNGWTITPENDALSADVLQGIVSAWEHARALRVTAANSVPRDGEVRVTFMDGEVLRFGVEIRDEELRLSRANPAVTYVLPLRSAGELLQITGNASDVTASE